MWWIEARFSRMKRASAMVAANKSLLQQVRKLAIRDELLAMRLRGRLVVPLLMETVKKPTAKG
ncbi:MAG: hypothetical protein WCC69_06665 [Pirellulales bacterium]